MVEREESLYKQKRGACWFCKISDPCPSAKPKQIPFQTAHLHGPSLSAPLSRPRALDIRGRVRVESKLHCNWNPFSLTVFTVKQNMPLAVLRIKTLLPGVSCVLSPWEIPVSHTVIYYTPVISDKEIERTYGLETILNHNSDLYTYCVYFCYLVYESFHHNISHTGSINKRNRPACLWMGGESFGRFDMLLQNYSNWGLRSTESTSHHSFFTEALMEMFMCWKTKNPLTRFVYMSPGIFGQMRSDVAPEWIKVKLFQRRMVTELGPFLLQEQPVKRKR